MGFPQLRKVPSPPPHPTHHTGSAVLDSAVTAFRAVTLGAAWDVGMACNIFKLQELLWPHPPDVQAFTSVNSCSSYTLDRAGIYRSHPLSTPWFAPNLNNPGRRPTVYHIHTQQGQQNREKANRIGRRPIVYREKANSIGRRPIVYREKANSIGRRPTV